MYESAYQTYRLAERILGGRQGLADILGLSYDAITFWHHRKAYMPFQYVAIVVAECDDPRITPKTLRPDYPYWDMLGRQLRKRHTRRADTAPPESPETIAA
jgi:hypothetical protein